MESFGIRVQKAQAEIKAPKSLYNKFGNYYYRNAESILEAFKPIGTKYSLILKIEDEIVNIGDRYYVKATASLIDASMEDKGVSLSTTAYAREPEMKKGMDESQITGSCSSYARKYALNGLLLLDDTKDADTDEQKIESDAKTGAKITPQQLGKIKAELLRTGVTEDAILKRYKVTKLEDLSGEMAQNCIGSLAKSKGVKDGN